MIRVFGAVLPVKGFFAHHFFGLFARFPRERFGGGQINNKIRIYRFYVGGRHRNQYGAFSQTAFFQQRPPMPFPGVGKFRRFGF